MENILYEINGRVATVTINRPKALNALNMDVLLEMEAVVKLLEQNGAVKVMVLTGAGEKAFVAGADIAAMQKMGPAEAEVFSRVGHRVMDRLEKTRIFTIAAVNGYALGGGCEVAIACDMRIASENAKLGIPEVTLGLFPGFGGTQRLPRLVGLGRAKELLATGQPVSAAQARDMGLVNQVVKPAELMPCCIATAEKIAGNSGSAISFGKQAMNAGMEMDQDKAMEYEAALFALVFTTADAKEGMTAFVEKRRASFQ